MVVDRERRRERKCCTSSKAVVPTASLASKLGITRNHYAFFGLGFLKKNQFMADLGL
jgi:hypothetical protein